MKRIFITGTDTDVGKTIASCAILRYLVSHGKSCVGLKPIAAGAKMVNGLLYNKDAMELRKASSVKLNYPQVNPVCFADPLSPHLAAEKAHAPISVQNVLHACKPTLNLDVDHVVIEGAGGWLVPVNDQHTMADIAAEMSDGIIMVVSMRLGCLNHSLLTYQSIKAMGLPFLGWIANCQQEDDFGLQDNIRTLGKMMRAPLLGVIPKLSKVDATLAAKYINLSGVLL